MNHLVFPEDCYCVMHEIVILKKLPCLHMVVLFKKFNDGQQVQHHMMYAGDSRSPGQNPA